MRLLDRFGTRQDRELREARSAILQMWSDGGTVDWGAFERYAEEGLRGSAPAFALIATRVLAFSEAELALQNRATRQLEATDQFDKPTPNESLSSMLALLELDNSLAGNGYRWKTQSGLHRVRPDHVRAVSAQIDPRTGLPLTEQQLAARVPYVRELVGYIYSPERHGGIVIPADEMAHFRPIPDETGVKGVSWLTSVARDVDADTSMSKHRLSFFRNAATPNLLVKVEGSLEPDEREVLRKEFDRRYSGVENAWRTAIVDAGADVQAVGHSFEQMAFEAVQSAGEARLSAAAGVPPQIVGFVKGLQAATYTNYQQAMRRFADLTLRPLWRAAADALSDVAEVPDGWRLWYDDRFIPFLQQDAKDESEIRGVDSRTIRTLLDAGYLAESVVDAVKTGDWTLLEHSGLFSVQLQKPGSTEQEIP